MDCPADRIPQSEPPDPRCLIEPVTLSPVLPATAAALAAIGPDAESARPALSEGLAARGG